MEWVLVQRGCGARSKVWVLHCSISKRTFDKALCSPSFESQCFDETYVTIT
jgi:hypothetical protein